jgi:tetratricopeptide (TPR) repeat protein
VSKTTLCSKCGTKFAANRDRCPKCHASVVRVDPAAQAAQSRRFAMAAGIVLGAFVLAVGGLWITQAAEPERTTTSSKPPADPLAARRAAPADASAPAQPADDEGPNASRPFLDAAQKGTTAYAAGDYAGSLERFEEAIKQNPNDAEALSNLGQVLVKLGRVTDAIPHLERATTLNPDRWAYRFNLARAQGLLQKWDESISSYRQAQSLFPDDYVTTFNLALALHKKGDDAAAVAEYKKAIALNPGEASFRMALAISFEALQQKQEAAGQYSEYLRLSPLASDAEKVRTKIAQLTGQTPPAAGPTAEVKGQW